MKAGSGSFDGEFVVELGLIDTDGNYNPRGEFWDLSYDKPVDPRLMDLRKYLERIPGHHAELVVEFTSEQGYDPGARGDYGQLMSPPDSWDERNVTGAFILFGRNISSSSDLMRSGEQTIAVPDDMLSDIASVYEQGIAEVEVYAEPDYDDDRRDRDRDLEDFYRREGYSD